MRRAPIVLTTTIAGVAGVLSFDAREPTAPTATAAAPSAATPAPSTTPAPAAPATGTTGQSSSATRTETGDAFDTQYGPAQVRVTITGGKITEVQALQLQGNERKSVEISSRAAPQLRASALSKQSGDIDAVSGATVTSASYEASLQSALDKAGFEAADGSRGSSEIPQVEEHGGRDDGGGFAPPPGG